MFWILLVVLYIVTFPVNSALRRRVWYRKYPPDTFETLGTVVPNEIILRAQLSAIVLFGVVQPAMAAVPMAFGERWYHWIAGGLAAIFYASSGSPTSYLDRVRSSHVMFLIAICVFVVSSLAVKRFGVN